MGVFLTHLAFQGGRYFFDFRPMSMKMMHQVTSAVAAIGLFSVPAYAAGVDAFLGEITGTPVSFSGTTVGADNDIDTYAPIGTSNAMWDQDYIFQFTVSNAGWLTLNSDDADGAGGIDNDFFLLTTLDVSLNEHGLRTATTLPTVDNNFPLSQGVWFLPEAGTYYLSVDAWYGTPLGVYEPGGYAGAFNGTLIFDAVPEPSAAALVVLSLAGWSIRRNRKRVG